MRLFTIQSMKVVSLVYTPGYPASAHLTHRVTVKRTTRKDVLTVHLFPKLTIPMRSQLPTLSSYSIRGPPLSP